MENQKNFYDAIVVGGGCAGLTSAIYLARASFKVLVIEKAEFGGQITLTNEVVNYPGTGKLSGSELANKMKAQAESFGAEFLNATVTKIETDGEFRKITTDNSEFLTHGLVIATGAYPRLLGFKGEEEFQGRGVAYCATCDGEFFTGKKVFVIGGGFSAAEEAVFLTKFAKHVTILIRGDDFKCAKSLADEAREHEKITVLTHTEVLEVNGDTTLRSITYKNNITNEITTYKEENDDNIGVFVFAGYLPESHLVENIVDIDENGYILTDRQQKTSVDGIYAAGDVCIKNLRQIVTATSDGATAATSLEKYITERQKLTGVKGNFKKIMEETKKEVSTKIFDKDIVDQLKSVFSKMENPLTLELHLDDTKLSKELDEYINEMASVSDKISVTYENSGEKRPFVKVVRNDGRSNLSFHGIPSGHEFTSFILSLYNMAGPGQEISEETLLRIKKIDKKVHLTIMVTLECTMCPELVISAGKVASLNDNVSIDIYDIRKHMDLKEKYNLMSVPAYIVNDNKPAFGKKDLNAFLDYLEKEI